MSRATLKLFCFVATQIFLISLKIYSIEALQCLECHPGPSGSTREICSRGGKKTICPSDATHCYMAEGADKDGPIVGRSCVRDFLVKQEGLKPNECVPIKERGVTGTICLCDTDNCNSAGYFRGGSVAKLSFLSISIVMIFRITSDIGRY